MEATMESTSFADRIAEWDAVARTDRAQDAIAPPAKRGGTYDESGQRHAEMLTDTVGEHPEWQVADFGCGDGRVTRHLVARFKTVWGIDASNAMLDRLTKRCPEVGPIRWDGASPPPWDNDRRFDLVCSFLTFVHYPWHDGREILEHLAQTLVPGGTLALQIPIYQTYREPRTWTSVGAWTPQQFVVAAQDAGLRIDHLHANRGNYAPGSSGPNHGKLQVLHLPE
jgi:trans-aconitate methyltransferase